MNRMKRFFHLVTLSMVASGAFAQSLLQSGPMVGYGQMTEVMLWVQTTKPAAVQFRYWDLQAPAKSSLSRSVNTSASDANVAHVLIDGLRPGTKYGYELRVNGKVIKRSYPLNFQTLPLWHWRTDPPDFTVAIGSCLYINETEWDRPGTPYGSDYKILSVIVSKRPDVMLWLGDNTYYREVDWHTVAGLRNRWTHTRSAPDLQPLLGATHHYALWDDHDYGPNDADRSYRLRSEALDMHKLFWANQTYGTQETRGVFGRFEWGDVEFFLLDDRYHRSPNRAPDDGNKTMFGKEQLQWLKDGLLSSQAPFKIVANGNQVLNPSLGAETFFAFRAEYEELLRFIKGQKITGVVFLSGDRHLTELTVLKDSSFYPLYDYTSSSLTAGLYPTSNNPAIVPGTLVSDAHTFGILRFSGPRRDRKLVMECWDHTGKLRWSHEINASQLVPPKSN